MTDKYSQLEKKIIKLQNKKTLENNIHSSFNLTKALNYMADFLSGVIAGGIIGYVTDSIFSKSPLFTIIFFLLGICAGIRNILAKI